MTIDYVSSFAFNGGDAMCNSECREILSFVGENYLGSKISTMEIYSNAVIIPNEKFIDVLKKYNIYFRFTDYGEHARQRIAEVIELFDRNNIRYDHVKFAEWCDMGYPQGSNGLYDDIALQNHFHNCDRRSCQLVSDGRFFFCGQAIAADRIGYCPLSENDYYDLRTTVKNKKEFLEFALGYSNNGYLNYCRKCNGSFNINKKRIPAGIQL
jgi:hypothetical protein